MAPVAPECGVSAPLGCIPFLLRNGPTLRTSNQDRSCKQEDEGQTKGLQQHWPSRLTEMAISCRRRTAACVLTTFTSPMMVSLEFRNLVAKCLCSVTDNCGASRGLLRVQVLSPSAHPPLMVGP